MATANTRDVVTEAAVPICVDLDGTLTPIDTLHECLLSLGRRSPLALLTLLRSLRYGKARVKHEIADQVDLHGALLPFRSELLAWLQAEREKGRSVVLATAADRKIAECVASHLGVFDDIVASDGDANLAGEQKRLALVNRFGEKGFDYVGNEYKDTHVWKSARQAIVVGRQPLATRARQVAQVAQVFPVGQTSVRLWLKAARVHQWTKNALVFLPALLAHAMLQPLVLADSLRAFFAFSLCASSVYIANDLFDLDADRQHPRKRHRPFASGALSARAGVIGSLLLLLVSTALALTLNWYFCAVLAIYYALTWAYSLRIKTIALLDVMTLACLYTLRIIAGAAATLIQPSFWLLAFSVFIFLSLGCVKRYAELDDAKKGGKFSPSGRGYFATDLPLLLSFGTAAGYCTTVVMALYVSSVDAVRLYHHSKMLWLVCPCLLFWVSRVWLITTRGQMHDDPVVFALKDRVSLLLLALIVVIGVLAI